VQVLSFDLGIVNQAWALTEKGQMLKCGRIKHPISDLTDKTFNSQKMRFLAEIKELMKNLTAEDIVLAERFQVRQFNPGAQIELVSVMLGLIASQSPGAFYPVTAANWKNYFLRTYNENTMEAFFNDAFDEHECDAIGLGLWYYEKETEKKSPYIQKFLPIAKSCRRCYWKYHGCKGEEKICKDFDEVDKRIKCNKCKSLDKCSSEIAKMTKAKNKKINNQTFGCVNYEAK